MEKKNEIDNLDTVTVDKLKTNYKNTIQQLNNSTKMTAGEKEYRKRVATQQYNSSLVKILGISRENTSKNTQQDINIQNKLNCLLIGINYFNTKYKLFGCINDTQMLRQFLKRTGFKNITTLTDDKNPKPTKQNILSNFTNLLKNARSGDLIVFTYSGHGSNILDKNNDEVDKSDEVIIASDYNRILDDEFKKIIQQYLKRNVTLFALFDCCHSGTIFDLKYQYMDSTNYDKDTINNNNADTLGNVIMISGCTDRQYSEDALINNKYQGAMTWSFLESMKTLKTPTWRELLKNMRMLLQNGGYNQTPQLSCGRLINIDSKIIL